MEERWAVVTGAASGIGRATAELLLADGIGVVGVDVDERGLSALAERGLQPLVADLGTEDGCDSVIAAARELPALDHVVLAAGLLRVQPIFEVTREQWRDIQRINAESTFFLCQGLGQLIRPGGAIVNLSSSSSKLATTTEVAAYAASKTTILSITRSFAYALAPRQVRVNAICPGIVDTPMQDAVLEGAARERGMSVSELSAQRNRTVPLGRAAAPEECARLIAFLLSEQAAYMTGQAINITGGLVTW